MPAEAIRLGNGGCEDTLNDLIAAINQPEDPDSLQLDLHLESGAPVTLLVRDESRSTAAPGDSETCDRDKCCRSARAGAVKQVSWGSTSSLANNDTVSSEEESSLPMLFDSILDAQV